MNFLERLVADWYSHQGYLVSTNLRFGPREKGGYDGEIDVLAIRLKEPRELIHVEASSDALSWDRRLARIERKFSGAKKYYPDLIGADFGEPRRIAIVGVKPPKVPKTLQGVELVSIDTLMAQIREHVRKYDPTKRAIPEEFALLRAVQFAVWFDADKKKGAPTLPSKSNP